MRHRLLLIGCILLLVVQFIFQLKAASTNSQTTDEAVHLSAGYTYLIKRDYRFNPEHPPLVKILAAIPLVILQPKVSNTAWQQYDKSNDFFFDSWRENRIFGEELLYESGNDSNQILFWTRFPIVILTFILGLSVFLITYRHFGSTAALIATALFTFDPNVNSHGHLVTTDIALALGAFLTIYSFWRLLQLPNFLRAILFGAALALALLVKHSAILLLPILFLIFIITRWKNSELRFWRSLAPKLLLSLVVVWILIWAGFGFRDRSLPISINISNSIKEANQQSTGVSLSGDDLQSSQQFSLTEAELNEFSQSVSRQDDVYTKFQPLLKILPGDYLKGLAMVIGHARGGHDSYLLGQSSKIGWWYYFPVLIFFKTPLPTLLLLTVALVLAVRKPEEKLPKILIASAIIFLLLAMTSKANLGLRHILLIYPLLFTAAGYLLAQNHLTKILTSVLISWLAVIFLWSYHGNYNYLAYYNEFAPQPYKIANDSNLDWGQDLIRINDFTDKVLRQPIYLEYDWDGSSALDHYLGKGRYQRLSDWKVGQTGTAIINVSALTRVEFAKFENCPDRQFITPGVISCDLNLMDE